MHPTRAGPSGSLRQPAPATPYMYPKRLCIQSKLARGWHVGGISSREKGGLAFPPATPLVIPITPLEPFFPKGNPYLGQAVLREPPLEANVLLLRPGVPQ